MKVTHIAKMYRPSIGGIENYIYNLNSELSDLGVDTSVLTTTESFVNTSSNEEREQNTTYCKSDLNVFRNPISSELYYQIKREDPDILHIHSPWFFTSLIAVLANEDTPIVTTIHGVKSINNSTLTRYFSRLYRPLAEFVLQSSDANIVLGKTERERMRQLFKNDYSNVYIIPNAIPPNEYDVQSPPSFSGIRELDKGSLTVLYVSRLVPNKNPELFIQIAEELSQADVQFLLVGGGDQKYIRELRDSAGENVYIRENVGFNDLKNIYFFSDLFVFLGSWEGLPTVVLEAMNAELPIISSPAGALPDLIKEDVNGQIISDYNVSTFANQVSEYLNNDSKRATIGKRNRKKVRDQYNWTTVASEILSVYQGVVK